MIVNKMQADMASTWLYRSWTSCRIFKLFLFTILTTAVSRSAEAHVKWFCGSVDVTAPPLDLQSVLSPTLLLVGFVSMTLVSAGGIADTIAVRRWPVLLWGNPRLEIIEELLVRYGAAIYLLLLWANIGAAPWGSAADHAILTPELLATDTWLRWLQLATGLLLLFRLTCPLAALGLVAIYLTGTARYGLFHLIDYLFFLGLAVYVALSGPFFDRRPEFRRWRIPSIAATVGFSLMWTAIEKFLYPSWAAIILLAHPNVTFGFPIPFVTVAAGFVEFSVAFYLLIGRGLLRFDAAIVVVVLLAAIPEFGALDTVGHLPLVVMLLAMVLHGPTDLPAVAHPRRIGIFAVAAWTAMLYILSFAVMMAMYYGLQKASASL